MKIKSYSKSGPTKGLFKQHAILAIHGSGCCPIVYLQRPKWIKNDEQWEAICEAVTLTLPVDFEVT